MHERVGVIKPIKVAWAHPAAQTPPKPIPPSGQAPRRATVTVIRAAGDAQIAGELVNAATAREIRIKDAQLRIVEGELDRAKRSNAANHEALIASVRIKYGPQHKTLARWIGDQIGACIAFGYCAIDALRGRRAAWR